MPQNVMDLRILGQRGPSVVSLNVSRVGRLPCSRYRRAGRWLPGPRNAIDLVRLSVHVSWATICWRWRTAHPAARVARDLLSIQLVGHNISRPSFVSDPRAAMPVPPPALSLISRRHPFHAGWTTRGDRNDRFLCFGLWPIDHHQGIRRQRKRSAAHSDRQQRCASHGFPPFVGFLQQKPRTERGPGK